MLWGDFSDQSLVKFLGQKSIKKLSPFKGELLMMLWEQFQVLWPSIAGHWVFLTFLATFGWYGFTRFHKNYLFKWQGPVIAATVVHFFMTANLFINIYQSNALYAHQQIIQKNNQEQQAQNQPQNNNVDPATQMKADFLVTLDRLMQNPAQINAENKQKLFTAFKELFPDRNARDDYAKHIGEAYQCQLHFWQDALASYKAKKPIKSAERKACEKKPGGFFNREKLLTDETIQNNDQTVAELAAHNKRVPASDGKEIVVTEAMVHQALESQIQAVANLKKIFE
jgi:hypothetical protein